MKNIKTLTEIIKLVEKINHKTDMAGFFDLSGHTDSLTVTISEGKEGDTKDAEGFRIRKFNNHLFREVAYGGRFIEILEKLEVFCNTAGVE